MAGDEQRAIHGVGLPDGVQSAFHNLVAGEVDHERNGESVKDLSESRDAHVAVPDLSYLRQIQVPDGPVDTPEAEQGRIVQHHDHPVASATKIEFDHVGALVHGCLEGRQRVLPLANRVAAVGNGDGHDSAARSLSLASSSAPRTSRPRRAAPRTGGAVRCRRTARGATA
jgi:hypothetical protein